MILCKDCIHYEYALNLEQYDKTCCNPDAKSYEKKVDKENSCELAEDDIDKFTRKSKALWKF